MLIFWWHTPESSALKYHRYSNSFIVVMSSAFDSVNLHFGSLVVAALIALVGSSTAESLTLGNHGAAGLIWATMSMFGAISIVRACVAATMPGWVRESLGLRNDATDAAVGQCLELQTDLKSRNRLGAAIGVVQIVPSKVRFSMLDRGPSMLRIFHL